MPARKATRPAVGAAVRDALDRQVLDVMLPTEVAAPDPERAEVAADDDQHGPPPTLEAELDRLRAEVDTLRSRLGRGAFERYEIPILVVIAAVLVAVIVIQLRA